MISISEVHINAVEYSSNTWPLTPQCESSFLEGTVTFSSSSWLCHHTLRRGVVFRNHLVLCYQFPLVGRGKTTWFSTFKMTILSRSLLHVQDIHITKRNVTTNQQCIHGITAKLTWNASSPLVASSLPFCSASGASLSSLCSVFTSCTAQLVNSADRLCSITTIATVHTVVYLMSI